MYILNHILTYFLSVSILVSLVNYGFRFILVDSLDLVNRYSAIVFPHPWSYFYVLSHGLFLVINLDTYFSNILSSIFLGYRIEVRFCFPCLVNIWPKVSKEEALLPIKEGNRDQGLVERIIILAHDKWTGNNINNLLVVNQRVDQLKPLTEGQ